MWRVVLFAVLLGAALVAVAMRQPPEALTGVVRVVDGDTIDVDRTRVRIFGIDAPEANQPLGPAATRWMRDRLRGAAVTCEARDTDRYGRTVAVCHAGGRDIGAEIVEAGLATAYVRYSTDYVDEEDAARRAGRGIWAIPATPVAAGSDSEQTCLIKGNISDNGRIYHLPGQEHYDRTRINTAKGERWFCTETEASEAGWRRARR